MEPCLSELTANIGNPNNGMIRVIYILNRTIFCFKQVWCIFSQYTLRVIPRGKEIGSIGNYLVVAIIKNVVFSNYEFTTKKYENRNFQKNLSMFQIENVTPHFER